MRQRDENLEIPPNDLSWLSVTPVTVMEYRMDSQSTIWLPLTVHFPNRASAERDVAKSNRNWGWKKFRLPAEEV